MIFAIRFIIACIAFDLALARSSALVHQEAFKNIPGNGVPSFHFFGPGQEYNRTDSGVEKMITGVCGGKSLTLRWRETFIVKAGTPRIIWIENLSVNEKSLDTSSLVKFQKIFSPHLADGFDIGCRWTEDEDYDFIVRFESRVYYSFLEYWFCTLGGPIRRNPRFTWYFYISEERGIFNPYVWPTGYLGDNKPAFRGAALEEPEPDDFPDCAAYEETGFPLTLE